MAKKNAGIALDNWKIPTYSRHLIEAGYIIDTSELITGGASLLKVDFDCANCLAATVREAEDDCQSQIATKH